MKTLRWIALLALAGAALEATSRSRATRAVAARCPPDRAALDEPDVHKEQLDTYQDLLDESLFLTFPASDPISAHAAARCADPCDTPANASDWHLHPGSTAPTAPAS
jgi:hypothetical protein